MSTVTSSKLLFIVAAVVGIALGCGRRPVATERTVSDVLVRVNGVPISAVDVRLGTRGEGHAGAVGEGHAGPAPEKEKGVLEGLILEELAAQRAVELGLDLAPESHAELERLEAQVADFRRRKLAEAYERREIAGKVDVSDAEARKFFDEHAAQIRTEVRVFQILLRDQGQIEQVRRDIDAGAPLEEVARRQLPKEAEAAGMKPWDLGYLHWNQVPEPWRDALARLEKGQTSGIIAGPRNRFWIIKLVDRRENPEITFEAVKPVLVQSLRSAKMEALRTQSHQALRSGARIVYEKPEASAK